MAVTRGRTTTESGTAEREVASAGELNQNIETLTVQKWSDNN